MSQMCKNLANFGMHVEREMDKSDISIEFICNQDEYGLDFHDIKITGEQGDILVMLVSKHNTAIVVSMLLSTILVASLAVWWLL